MAIRINTVFQCAINSFSKIILTASSGACDWKPFGSAARRTSTLNAALTNIWSVPGRAPVSFSARKDLNPFIKKLQISMDIFDICVSRISIEISRVDYYLVHRLQSSGWKAYKLSLIHQSCWKFDYSSPCAGGPLWGRHRLLLLPDPRPGDSTSELLCSNACMYLCVRVSMCIYRRAIVKRAAAPARIGGHLSPLLHTVLRLLVHTKLTGRATTLRRPRSSPRVVHFNSSIGSDSCATNAHSTSSLQS